MTEDSLVIRPLAAHEARDLFTSLTDPGLVGRALLGRPYTLVEEDGEYRPDWAWVALRDGAVVARAALWAAPSDEKPLLLDWFDFLPGEGEAAAALLREMPRHEYELILPPGWRSDPQVRAAAEARIEAAGAAGYHEIAERFRYEWTPECGLPPRRDRLVFRPEPDDALVLDLLRRIQADTLDAHARQALTEGGVEQAAQEDMDHLRRMSSPRSWWRVAETRRGETVGLHVPALIPSGPAVAFIGVVPEQRGRAYSYDLLADCTHQLVTETGARTIAAATDLGNAPMARAFARAGYPVAQHRYCMA